MSISESVNRHNEERREPVDNGNRKLERVGSGVGWGLLLILIGTLIFADNQGWLQGGAGWLYFIIGVGAIFILGFLVRYFGHHGDHWSGFGGLVAGLSLVYVGTAFLYGFGEWWPLVFVVVGIGYLAKAVWRHSQSYVP